MPKSSLADHSDEWETLIDRVRAYAEDLPELLGMTDELDSLLGRGKAVERERAALDARSQQLTRDLEAIKNRARTVAARIRSGVKTRYGFGDEKLTEFGMRPRRKKLQSRLEEARAAEALDPAGSENPT